MPNAYRKTAKGVDAIASRSRELPTRLRPLLILIDGRRGLPDLQAMAGQFGDIEQMLGQLVEGGFAEAVGADAPASPVPSGPAPLAPSAAVPPVAAPAPQAPAAPTLAQARLAASRLLLELMGPTSESLCLRLETARTRAEFIEAARRAHAMLRELRGAEVAERFGAAVESRLPAD